MSILAVPDDKPGALFPGRSAFEDPSHRTPALPAFCGYYGRTDLRGIDDETWTHDLRESRNAILEGIQKRYTAARLILSVEVQS